AVTPPFPNAKVDTAIMRVYPATSPQDAATSDLVKKLRDQVIPQATQGTGVQVLIDGETAFFVDFATKIGQRLPVLIGVVILLSRIREEYLRTRDNGLAVANGVASTGRVITAAAAVMIAVFLTFVVGFDVRQIKEIGLGLAVAILVDATLVRMVLVPSTMELLRDANWWFPRWMQ